MNMEGNLAADDYFGQATGKTDTFGAGNYFLAFLGTPSNSGLWELQFGGHHYAFGNTYEGGKLLGVTPSFRGVEPMSAVTVNGKTYQPMEQERVGFRRHAGRVEQQRTGHSPAAELISRRAARPRSGRAVSRDPGRASR